MYYFLRILIVVFGLAIGLAWFGTVYEGNERYIGALNVTNLPVTDLTDLLARTKDRLEVVSIYDFGFFNIRLSNNFQNICFSLFLLFLPAFIFDKVFVSIYKKRNKITATEKKGQ